MVQEKVSNNEGLPLPQTQQQAKVYPCHQSKGWRARLVATFVCALVFFWMDYRSPFIFSWSTSSAPPSSSSSALAVCKQYPAWSPPEDISLPALLPSSTYAQLLSGAVRIDTTVSDTWGPLDSPNVTDVVRENYRKAFEPFEAYLAASFPRVHAVLQKEVVDEHGLIFTWEGSDQSLKPLVLMAHQDVVPVEPSSVGQWVHEPFSGFIDEEKDVVWGRGASDDKASLVAIMSALESLASSDSTFAPRRTIIASFGFDEESTGSAAAALAAHLVSRYGDNGAELIVDEGGSVLGPDAPDFEGGMGVAYAGPATSEKGYIDVRVTVRTPGGHSSVPPPRTGIGYLARIVANLEDHAPQPKLDDVSHPALAPLLCLRDAPAIRKDRPKLYKALQRLAEHLAADEAATPPSGKVKCRRRQRRQQKLLDAVLPLLSSEEKSLFTTTQAVDLISGGVKVNALPERSEAIVNHRIDVLSSVAEVKERVTGVVKKESERLGLEFAGWVEEQDDMAMAAVKGRGSVSLSVAYDSALEPTPSSPVVDDGNDSASAWRLLSSVIRSTWQLEEAAHSSSHPLIPVIPTIMGGNTDTKSYHALSRNIFRFSGGTLLPPPKGIAEGGIHTVNEYAPIDALVKGVEFYRNLIWATQEM